MPIPTPQNCSFITVMSQLTSKALLLLTRYTRCTKRTIPRQIGKLWAGMLPSGTMLPKYVIGPITN